MAAIKFRSPFKSLLAGALCTLTLGCASGPSASPGEWQGDLVRLKKENAQVKEQLRVARLQIHHLERRAERYRELEAQIFQNIQTSYQEKQWDLLRTQVDQVLKDFSPQDERVIQSVFYLAELGRQLGEETHALQAYDWLQRNPANKKHRASTHLGMGLVYGQMGLHKEARENFSKILQEHPSSPEAVLASREISDLTHLQSARRRAL